MDGVGFLTTFADTQLILYIYIFFNFRRIVYSDLNAIAPEQYYKQITNRLAEIKAVSVSNTYIDYLFMFESFTGIKLICACLF